ncbi:MAG: response regulator transcription factor [Candidatus Dormiibacterota bacterium]
MTDTALTVGAAPVGVLIADDRPLVRHGMTTLLGMDPRIRVLGVAADGQQAVERTDELRPAVVLMDVEMPRLDGIQATAQIKRMHPEVKVLMLTNFAADGYFTGALQAGAQGYLLKDAEPESVISSILAVAQGERVMASAIADRMLDLLTNRASPEEMYDGLTAREVEILKLVASGMPNKQIAYQLRISDKTARNHISRIYEKLGIHDRSKALLYAVRKGLVKL